MKKTSTPAATADKPPKRHAAGVDIRQTLLDIWLRTPEARCLVEVPIAPDCFEEAMEYRLKRAFEAGFIRGWLTEFTDTDQERN